jgi:hypothetical protein
VAGVAGIQQPTTTLPWAINYRALLPNPSRSLLDHMNGQMMDPAGLEVARVPIANRAWNKPVVVSTILLNLPQLAPSQTLPLFRNLLLACDSSPRQPLGFF